MYLGLALLYVGAVLVVNGIWLLGKMNDREVAFINLFTGFITLTVALYSAFGPGANAASVMGGALTLLFSATYLWVAYNCLSGSGGRGLGWFCLFVAITVIPVALMSITAATDASSLWLGLNWILWAMLWFAFFLLLALEKPITVPVGYSCIAIGIITAWLPGFLLLNGQLT